MTAGTCWCEVMSLKRERDILAEQLRNAEQTPATLSGAPDLPAAPEPRRSSEAPLTKRW